MTDYSSRNATLKDEFEDASSRLDAAWASGPSNNSAPMSAPLRFSLPPQLLCSALTERTAFAAWFDGIYNEFYFLWVRVALDSSWHTF
jgi:hypothetical protein